MLTESQQATGFADGKMTAEEKRENVGKAVGCSMEEIIQFRREPTDTAKRRQAYRNIRLAVSSARQSYSEI